MLGAALACGAIALGACGDDSPGNEGAAASSPSDPDDALIQEFIGPDEVGFGREATASERHQASRAVEAWMQAREDRDWVEVCANLHPPAARAIARDASLVTGRKKSCPAAHAYFGEEGLGDLTNIMRGPVGSLRIAQGQGSAYFHGSGGTNWSVGMRKEDGKWGVTLIAPIEQGQ